MKTSVSLTLIICGTVLVFVPLIDDILGVTKVAQVMMELGGDVNIKSGLTKGYEKLCVTVGCIMILVGAYGSFGKKHAKKTRS